MSVENRTKALAWLEMSEGVEWVANRLRVHLSTIRRLTLKIQRVGDDKGVRTRIGRRQA